MFRKGFIIAVFCVLLCLALTPDLVAARRGKNARGRTRRKPSTRNSRNSKNRAAREDLPSPVTEDIEPQPMHTLAEPFTDNLAYWSIGGSSVVTSNKVRLTPSISERSGWLWNNHPLGALNWETEIQMQIYSKPHFGGEGVGFWILHEDMDPAAYRSDPNALTGTLNGMKQDFKGFGVMLDVYDNDHLRDNPSVFVLENLKGEKNKFNDADNDYRTDMYSSLPAGDSLKGHTGKDGVVYRSQKCQAKIRNTGKPGLFLLKYIQNVLHVYVNDNGRGDRSAYKFCLAVEFPAGTVLKNQYHLAITGQTGQVADAHDLLQITTRYLPDDTEQIDDLNWGATYGEDTLSRSGSGSFGVLLFFVGGLVVGVVWFAYNTLSTDLALQLDTVKISSKVNAYVLPHYALQGLMTALSLLCGWYVLFVLNAALTVFHVHSFVKGNHLYRAYLLAKLKGGHHTGKTGLLMSNLKAGPAQWSKPHHRIGVLLIWYVLLELYIAFSVMF